MEEASGWIKLSRKILQSKYYLGEKFTKAMCWIDLLLLAEWRNERRFYLRGIEVVVSRGQVAMALTDLHKRWGLSINTVRGRLREMVVDGRITIEANNVVTKITILNWEKYQCGETPIENVIVDDAPAPAAPLTPDPPKPKDEPIEEVIAEEITIPASSSPKKPEVDCAFVVKLYHDRCPSLPKVIKLSDKRKMKIRVRFEEMGYDYGVMQNVFDKAEASRFMRGDNQHGWSADFDWIFANGTNWVKILEGKYDNKDQKIITPTTNNGTTSFIPSAPPVVGGGYTPTTPSQRQQLSVLTTLAKIEAEQGGGYMPPGTGTEN